MSLALWLAIAGGLAMLVGVLLLIAGVRGKRLDDHPCCRRCGFDLHGLNLGHDQARCPECGRAARPGTAATKDGSAGPPTTRASRRAARPLNIRIGCRRKRPAVAWLGAAMVLLIALPAGTISALLWSGASLDHYKPIWWLVQEGDSRNLDTAGRARAELRRRLVSDEVSAGGARAIARAALALQAAPQGMWNPDWGNLFEIAWLGGWLDEELTGAYLRQAIRFQIVRVAAPSDDPDGSLRLELRIEDRTGDILLLTARAALHLPENSDIHQSLPGEFNLAGDAGSGAIHLMPRPAGVTRDAWFKQLGLAFGAAQTLAGPLAGVNAGTLLGLPLGSPVPSSMRIAPRSVSTPAATAPTPDDAPRKLQQLSLSSSAPLAGSTLTLDLWVGAGGPEGRALGRMTSWWSDRPIPAPHDRLWPTEHVTTPLPIGEPPRPGQF